jgi:uncharacterized phage protein (TIGR02218 family)
VTYAQDEESVSDGEPIELYEFIGPTATYRYTSNVVAVEYEGDTYAPTAGLGRSAFTGGSTQDPGTLEVQIGIAAQVVRDYGFATPPRNLRLRIHRQQANSGAYQVGWDGTVIGIRPRGRTAVVRSSSQLGERLRTSLPSVVVQPTCNHFLYDAHCAVTRIPFSLLVSGISGNTLTLNSTGGAPDDWFRAGEIVRDLDGERRTIVDQVGAVLTLFSTFGTLANGDAVTVYAGCDHTVQTCSDKFNNVVNFGGMPSIQPSNPFIFGIRLRSNY